MEQEQEKEGDGGTSRLQWIRKLTSSNGFRLSLAHTAGLALAIPIIALGASLHTRKKDYCITFIEKPLISLGLLLALASIAGLFATWKRLHWLHLLHTVSLFLLVLLLFCFAIFSIEITSSGSGHSIVVGDEALSPTTPPSYAFKEYVLQDYPKWMRRKVENKHEWKGVTRCLKRNGFCGPRIPYNGSDPLQYNHSPLSPIQSGCCKPPIACKFQYIDALHWITPSNVGTNDDCVLWDNNPERLCYQCSSCKAGVIQATKDRWARIGVTLFVVVIVLVTLYAIVGSLAFRHER